jgi:hypothetical protein
VGESQSNRTAWIRFPENIANPRKDDLHLGGDFDDYGKASDCVGEIWFFKRAGAHERRTAKVSRVRHRLCRTESMGMTLL